MFWWIIVDNSINIDLQTQRVIHDFVLYLSNFGHHRYRYSFFENSLKDKSIYCRIGYIYSNCGRCNHTFCRLLPLDFFLSH
jgi:hypothetical protein